MNTRLLLFFAFFTMLQTRVSATEELWVGQTYYCFASDYYNYRYSQFNVSWSVDNGLYTNYSGTHERTVSFKEYKSGTYTVKVTWMETDMSNDYDPTTYHRSHTWNFTCKDNPLVLSQTSMGLTVGQSQQLSCSFTYNNSYTQGISYSSSNTSVATVSSSGLITAKGEGTATITVSSSSSRDSKTCIVTVTPGIRVSSIVLNKSSLSLEIGQEVYLTATVKPDDASNKSVTWSSSNSSVATVNNTGKVTAIAKGSATINCRSNDGSGVSTSCSVIVKSQPVYPIALSVRSSISMKTTDSYNLSYSYVYPEGTDYADGVQPTVTYSSSNTNVVQVSKWGNLTAVQAGTATVTLSCDKGLSATCDVRIIEETVPVKLEAKHVSSFGFHSAILDTEGVMWACGNNDYGQLGDGYTDECVIPKQIMSDVATVAAGNYHTLILKKDGTLWACGRNNYGQLGDGTTIDCHVPKQVMMDVDTVAVGSDFTMILKTDGTLWACGYNYHGQLGDGTTENCETPKQVMSDVAFVSTGHNHTMIIKKDGSLWGCGDNIVYQLGDGTKIDCSNPKQIMTNVAYVSAGGSHTMILKADGSLWACGRNIYGELGDGTTTWKYTPGKIMDNVASVSAGLWHTMILKKDGTLWACGYNDDGQLGDGTSNGHSNFPKEIMTEVAYVSAGLSQTTILKKDMSLWACGRNAYGNLGDGTNVGRYTPVKIAGKRDAEEPTLEGIAINETNFPDDNFRNYLLKQEYGKDGVLTESEIQGITYIVVSGDLFSPGGISSLKGVEFFTALTVLDCTFNKLTSLDVSKNTALESLSCGYNQLTSLDVSQNTALTELWCPSNQLTSLDVSKNTALTGLSCCINKISGKNMDNLIKSLPQNETEKVYEFYVIANNFGDDFGVDIGNYIGNEENVCTKSQVAAAKAKGWIPYYYDATEYNWKEYEGSEDEEPALKGDVNGDCEVNGTDLVALTNMILGRSEKKDAADLNGDDEVNGTDYVALVNIILGKSNSRMMAAESNECSLSIEDFDIKAGETKEMLIDLTNPNDEITLVQFDMRLPEGLSIEQEYGEYAIDIAGRTNWRKHSLNANATNGIIRFLLSSANNVALGGTSGAIISIKLTASENFNGGNISLENILLVTPNEKEIKPANVEYTLGNTTTDTAFLCIEDFNIKAGDTKEMLIDLINPDNEITLVQFDLKLPNGISIVMESNDYAVDIAGRTTWRKHSLNANATDGIIRFLLSSTNNAVIEGTTGGIISIKLQANEKFKNGIIKLENILLVTPDEHEIKPDDVVYDLIPTGIENLVGSEQSKSATIYSLSGQRLQKPVKGVNIIDGRKVVVK